jgi:ABC-type Fe3+-hydroxamate transport system substrate-binding protein
MGFNRTTYCHDILACSGGANLCADATTRYPEVDLARIAAAAPEVILLPDEPYPFTASHFDALAPLHRTPAWEQGRVHLVDGKALSWYGPRTPAAVELFRRLLAAALMPA